MTLFFIVLIGGRRGKVYLGVGGKAMTEDQFDSLYSGKYIYSNELLKGDEKWRNLAETVISKLTNADSEIGLDSFKTKDLEGLGNSLLEMAEIEREKELEILQDKLKLTVNKSKRYYGRHYIQIFNRAFNTKALYDHAIKSMKAYLELNKEGQEKYNKMSGVKLQVARAENVTHKIYEATMENYASKLVDCVRNNDRTTYESLWGSFLKDFKKNLIDSEELQQIFSDQLLNKKDLEYLRSISDDFEAADNAAKQFKEDFMMGILENFFSGRASENLKNHIKELDKNDIAIDKPVTESKIGLGLSYRGKGENGKQGNIKNTPLLYGISEILGASVATAINSINQQGIFSFKAVQQGRTGADIDVGYFMSLPGVNIDLSLPNPGFVKDKKEFLSNKLYEMEEKYAQAVKGMAENEDAIAIYESTKLYQEDHVINDYFSGTAYGYESAKNLIKKLIENSSGIDLFFQRLLNEAPGGLPTLINFQERDYDILRRIVAENVASFLFDDYWNLGNSIGGAGVKAIHIFRVQNIVIPLSSFLFGLGNAAKHTGEDLLNDSLVQKWVSVKVTNGDINETIKGISEEDEMKRWNKVLSNMQSSFKVQILFLKNFSEDMVNEFKNWS